MIPYWNSEVNFLQYQYIWPIFVRLISQAAEGRTPLHSPLVVLSPLQPRRWLNTGLEDCFFLIFTWNPFWHKSKWLDTKVLVSKKQPSNPVFARLSLTLTHDTEVRGNTGSPPNFCLLCQNQGQLGGSADGRKKDAGNSILLLLIWY